MSFLLDIAILIVAAKALGEISERLNYPSILGYILAGVLVGPWLGLVDSANSEITVFAQLGAILLLFVAGIREVRLGELLEKKTATLGTAFLAYLFPFFGVLYILLNTDIGIGFGESLLLLAAISIPNIITSVKTLIKKDSLDSIIGKVLLNSHAIHTMAGLFIFTVIISFLAIEGVDVQSIVGISALTFAFFLVFWLAEKTLPALISSSAHLAVEEAQFTMVFVVMLGLVYLASLFGLNGIIGAYLAGIIVSKTHLQERGFYEKLASLTYGIFVPVFFAWAGMQFVPGIIEPSVLMLIIVVVIASTVLGGFIGSKLGNINTRDAAAIGTSLIPRGGVDLIIVAAAMSAGVLAGTGAAIVMTIVIAVDLVSMIITPFLLNKII